MKKRCVLISETSSAVSVIMSSASSHGSDVHSSPEQRREKPPTPKTPRPTPARDPKEEEPPAWAKCLLDANAHLMSKVDSLQAEVKDLREAK